MISELLKEVMLKCGLKQADLAVVLDASLSRVKAMTSGRVQKLTPDETRRLVQALNLSAHWLATGEGPMFNTMGGEKLGELLTQTRLTTSRLQAIEGLGEAEARAVTEVVVGLHSGNLDSLLSGLRTGGEAQMSDGERALLASYRRCNQDGQSALIQTAALLAAGIEPPSQKRGQKAPSSRGTEQSQGQQVFNAEVGQSLQVSGNLDQRNVRFTLGKGGK